MPEKKANIHFLKKDDIKYDTVVVPDSDLNITLYTDDSIQTIKEKIMYVYLNKFPDNPKVSLEEMYLFIVVERPFNLKDWYKNVTQNEKIKLTRELFSQLLVNFHFTENINDNGDLESIAKHEFHSDSDITYEELLRIKWFSERVTVFQKVPLGIRIEIALTGKTKRIIPYDEMFCANPFDIISDALSSDLQRSFDNKEPIILDNEFLFHYGRNPINLDMYVCFAEDVLKDIDDDMMKFYFPYLHKKGISNLSYLRDKKEELLEKTESIMNHPKKLDQFQSIDIFHSVKENYEERGGFPFKEKGIDKFSLIIENNSFFQTKIQVPLESIFKNLHATVKTPYIRHFATNKSDPYLRIHYNDLSKDGKQIPSLSEKVILDMHKVKRGLKPHILIFVNCSNKVPTSLNDFVEFIIESNGNVRLQGVLERPLMYNEFQDWLKNETNNVFDNINGFLLQSGYGLKKLDKLCDHYVRVSQLSFKSTFELTKKLNFEENYECLSALLSIEPDNEKKKEPGQHYRYKRVEHFQIMDDTEQYISQLLKITQDKRIVEKQMRKQYPQLSKLEISKLLTIYASKYRTINGSFINKKKDSLATSGFPITFLPFQFGSTCSFYISNIDRIEYIWLIPKFIESILILSQYKETEENKKWFEENKKWFEIWNKKNGILGQDIKANEDSDSESDSDVNEKKEKLFENQETAIEEGSRNNDDYDDDDSDADSDNIDLDDDYLDLIQNNDSEEEKEEEKEKEKQVEGEEENNKNVKSYEPPDNDSFKDSFESPLESITNEKVTDNKDNSNDDDYDDDAGIDIDIDLMDDSNDEKNSQDDEEKGKQEEEEEEDYTLGGAKAPKNLGIKSYFTERIHNRDPTLFETMEGYTKVCQESQRRQPVILTEKEMQKYNSEYKINKQKEIDKGDLPEEAKKLLNMETSLKYRNMHYVCPRFWCTKPGEERALTAAEVDDPKVCGKVITDYNKPKEGEHIYDRNDWKSAPFRPSPSFITKTGKDGKDICYPCCFGQPNPKKDAKCMMDNVENIEENKNESRQDATKFKELYLLGYRKKESLTSGRHGIVPFPVQQFLGIDASNSCIEVGDNKMRLDCPMFLTYGVEQTYNNDQSFLACMADLYSYENKIGNPIKLSEFRKVLSKTLTLDVFVQLQNGSLVSQFTNNKVNIDDIEIKPYENQILHKNIDKREDSQINFLKHSINSYEKFLQYINDPEVKIDHNFLWDFMSQPILFKKGVNLMILEVMLDDITNKVDLICPTNHYKRPLFELSKPTVILLKHGNIYEPIYKVVRDGKKKEITYQKYFENKNNDVGDMKTILEMVKNLTESKCAPFVNKSSHYKFERNLPANEIFGILESLKMKPTTSILNYQGKIIAFMVPYNGKNYYLPCYPTLNSDIKSKTAFKWMDDISLWNDYHTTVDFLKNVYEKSDKKIPCKPKYRIVEDGLIVGILSITNQFIQFDPPMQNTNKEYPEMKSSKYIMADKKIMSPKEHVDQNDIIVKYIYLENQFYNSFRTTVRILLHYYENRDILKNIQKVIYKKNATNEQKTNEIEKYLRYISDPISNPNPISKSKVKADNNHAYVEFHEYPDMDVLLQLHQVFTCNSNDEDKSYCIMKNIEGTKKKSTLLIPKYHLLTKEENDKIYFLRLSDELLRHKRVHLFMFYPEQFLNINDQDYSIVENEMLIPKSLLDSTYFKEIKKYEYKEYARTVTYDNAENAKPLIRPPVRWINEYETVKNKFPKK